MNERMDVWMDEFHHPWPVRTPPLPHLTYIYIPIFSSPLPTSPTYIQCDCPSSLYGRESGYDHGSRRRQSSRERQFQTIDQYTKWNICTSSFFHYTCLKKERKGAWTKKNSWARAFGGRKGRKEKQFNFDLMMMMTWHIIFPIYIDTHHCIYT